MNPYSKILIRPTPIGYGKVIISTLDGESKEPIEEVFTGAHSAAAKERVRRFERWSNSGADEVTAEPMPIMF